jgi:predicted LPLAT superfamily acyltransferase
MKLLDKIEQGEYIAIVGDRTSIAQHGRIIEADFIPYKDKLIRKQRQESLQLAVQDYAN